MRAVAAGAAGAGALVGMIAFAVGCATGSETPAGSDGGLTPGPDAAVVDAPLVDAPVAIDAPGTMDAAPIDGAAPDARPIDAAPPPDAQTAVCTAEVLIACGQNKSGTLSAADDSVAGHTCGSQDTTTGDRIYSFVAPTSGQVLVSLDVVDDVVVIGDDFDLYVLGGSCNPDQCIAYGRTLGDETVSFTATAGSTYYLVVEAFALGFLTSTSYTLGVSCP